MFKTMGFHNVAILDGGSPLWLELGYPVQNSFAIAFKKGSFTANYTSGLIYDYTSILNAIKDSKKVILDARSYHRYLGTISEPTEGLRSGHIQNSKSLPYTTLLNGVQMKSREVLKEIFPKYSENNFIFLMWFGNNSVYFSIGCGGCRN